MQDRQWLTARFEAQRHRLQAVAYRMLGSRADAHDAVQQAWLRLDCDGRAGVDNLPGWLTTVVARCAWTCCGRGPPAGSNLTGCTYPTT